MRRSLNYTENELLGTVFVLEWLRTHVSCSAKNYLRQGQKLPEFRLRRFFLDLWCSQLLYTTRFDPRCILFEPICLGFHRWSSCQFLVLYWFSKSSLLPPIQYKPKQKKHNYLIVNKTKQKEANTSKIHTFAHCSESLWIPSVAKILFTFSIFQRHLSAPPRANKRTDWKNLFNEFFIQHMCGCKIKNTSMDFLRKH